MPSRSKSDLIVTYTGFQLAHSSWVYRLFASMESASFVEWLIDKNRFARFLWAINPCALLAEHEQFVLLTNHVALSKSTINHLRAILGTHWSMDADSQKRRQMRTQHIVCCWIHVLCLAALRVQSAVEQAESGDAANGFAANEFVCECALIFSTTYQCLFSFLPLLLESHPSLSRMCTTSC